MTRKPWGWSKGRWEAYLANRRGIAAKNLYIAARRNTYKPNGKTEEVIGLISGSFTHITTDAVPGTLTQTIFDTTSRADSAQILLTNSTGGSRVVVSAWIRGKAVTRLSGKEGYLHDKFVDYEMQAKDGDITYETGNNFVVTADQVNKLADYYWKLNKTKKHIYTLSLVGFQTWYEPGEWYTLQIGGAGEAEYIDSTVECFDVRCSISAGGAGYTSVSFREVEESWKFDSNETARMIASGGFQRRPSQNVVTVAAQYYSGYADYYCDGTNDQEEINKAIALGVGRVQLTKGVFVITTSISVADNIELAGCGNGTVIQAAASEIACITVPTANNTIISTLAIDGANQTTGIYVTAGENYLLNNLYIYNHIDGISCLNPTYGKIVNSTIANSSSAYDGIIINTYASSPTIVQSNYIGSCNIEYGIRIGGVVGDRQNILIANNVIKDLVSNDSIASELYGIYVAAAEGISINSNRIESVVSTTTSLSYGIYINDDASDTIVNNNFIKTCGNDTGIANTNGNLFSDNGTDTQWAG